jgi:hypothetical protein
MQKNIPCASNDISQQVRRLSRVRGVDKGMKKYVRDIMDDLKNAGNKDFLPAVPESPVDGKTAYLDPPKVEPAPADLDNQTLSQDNQEAVKQLDYQAQKDEEREGLG